MESTWYICLCVLLLCLTWCQIAPNNFVAQGTSSTVKVIPIMTKYVHQNVFGHIFLSSQPFLMIQGAELEGLCVETRGHGLRDR